MYVYRKIIDSNNEPVNKSSQEIIEILENWFLLLENTMHLAIEDGEINEEADDLIALIDNDLEGNESWRIPHQFEALPEFSRLSPGARKALFEELKSIVKYQQTHREEYCQKLKI